MLSPKDIVSALNPAIDRFAIEITSAAGEPSLVRHSPLHSSGSAFVGVGKLLQFAETTEYSFSRWLLVKVILEEGKTYWHRR